MERELSLSQKMFLQSILHYGFMDSSTVKASYQSCRERYDEPTNLEDLRNFLRDINAQIRFMDIEVRKGFDEDSGLACYVAINTVDNPFLQGTGKYTLKQMEYFKMLMKLIVLSDEGSITMVDALNAVDSLDFKLSKHEAAQLIEKDWVTSDKWLKGVTPFQLDRTQDEEYVADNTMITLGTRSIVELERYIRDTFSEYVKDCNICTRICIRGLVCRQCEHKVHAGCVKSYLSKQKQQIPLCPNKQCGVQRSELLGYHKSRQRANQSQH
ncbi:NSMCE1 [Bugula neritina]|uniref:Non-structural maintenance of chromosomes element 1 homolog n=1 Tax=Bugula neritina TaxID=10212 RepID=A0A7J7ITE5_BUGNE|nr:NSMCE1 [Bugula neritina]KAF6022886.1 NSMCE1 [Bugula neritina]